jgi:tripartite-type tricarboxylate transporter receptor subunit TctC
MTRNAWLVALILVVMTAAPASAADFPARPLRIVTQEAGGGTDFAARLLAPQLTQGLGYQVVVENRPGIVSGEVVARASPDGYTMLLSGSTLLVAPLFQKTTFDTVRDFAPISLTTRAPNLLVVHPGVNAATVRDLIALAKAKPGALNYGSAATGSTSHLSGELFRILAGVNIVRVNYKGTGGAIIALISGEVQMLFAPAGSVLPHVKSGKLRALAVTSERPSPLVPGLPTVAASGLPGYSSAAITSVSAPARTPAAIIGRLNAEVVKALSAPELKQKLLASGTEAAPSTPAELGAMVQAEIAKWRKAVDAAGITPR